MTVIDTAISLVTPKKHTSTDIPQNTAIFKPQNIRQIIDNTGAFVVPYVVVAERHSDNYVVTTHPTEFGTLVSDYMYALPKRVDIEVAYSLSMTNASSNTDSVNDYYAKFLKLQATKTPFTLITGKRNYPNMMVIQSIDEFTDKHSEYSVKLMLKCIEVIIVNISVENTNGTTTNPINTNNSISTTKKNGSVSRANGTKLPNGSISNTSIPEPFNSAINQGPQSISSGPMITSYKDLLNSIGN